MDKLWAPCGSHADKPSLQTVVDCTYSPVLGYFNNWNIIKFKIKKTPSEGFDDIHKGFLDGISKIWHHCCIKVNIML